MEPGEVDQSNIDFFSENFDPAVALSRPGVVPPVASAPPEDNISCCRKLLPGYVKPTNPETNRTKVSSKSWRLNRVEVNVTAEDGRRAIANLNAEIQNRISDKSPLGWLKACTTAGGARCKVWIRRRNSVRGTCTGCVVSFDKHFNLLLSEVVEEFTQKTEQGTEQVVRRKIAQRFVKGNAIIMIAPAPDETHTKSNSTADSKRNILERKK